MLSTTTVDIPVVGGMLRALRFGEGPRTIVAAHGITASGMEFGTVARYLPPGWNLLAIDLRGRGGSSHLPGPYGMAAHAADLCAAAELAGAPVVLLGHSMGGYAAVRAAASRPDLFSRLVLVDGGLPLPVPPGADPDEVLRVTVGPAIARLSATYPSVEEYVAFFRRHPALAADWTPDVDAYVRYDATGQPGAVRSRVNADAVAVDGRDLLVNADSYGEDIAALTIPALLLYAPRGMLGQEPGLLPKPVVDAWTTGTPLTGELVPDCNHYTIVLSPHAAGTVARRLTA
jgi:pimeloyl-ACP methyl ester carboxylesterase